MVNWQQSVELSEKLKGLPPDKVLGEAIDWIRANLGWDEVFDKAWMGADTEPSEVFDTEVLGEWALSEGYVSPDSVSGEEVLDELTDFVEVQRKKLQ